MFDDVWETHKKVIIDKFSDSDDSGRFFEYLVLDYCPIFYEKFPNEKRAALYQLEFYKKTLSELKKEKPNKFNTICKGTPYYLMGMFAFYTHNYEQAVFYINEAVTEDKRFPPEDWWKKSSAAKFFFLNDEYPNLQDAVFKNFITSIRFFIEEEIRLFARRTGTSFDFEKLKEFVSQIITIKGNNEQSIITSLYSFIVEKQDILSLLETRSSSGIIIEPILFHLFKGAIVFESLLKKYYGSFTYKYKNRSYLLKDSSLETILTNNNVKSKLVFKFKKSHTGNIRSVIDTISGASIDNAFKVTYKIRNISAHNLCWDDGNLFNNTNTYINLYNKVIDSIFYIISKNI